MTLNNGDQESYHASILLDATPGCHSRNVETKSTSAGRIHLQQRCSARLQAGSRSNSRCPPEGGRYKYQPYFAAGCRNRKQCSPLPAFIWRGKLSGSFFTSPATKVRK